MWNRKIGLVLSGGGGKGAYQIGVWKALREYNIIPSAVAGTSVGALNVALLLGDDYEAAESIWTNIEANNVLSLNMESLPETVVSKLTKMHVNLDLLPLTMRTRGLFSQKGLLTMMDAALDEQKIKQSAIPFFACVHHVKGNRVRYFHINQQEKETIRKVLLASAALPGIFDDVEINGEVYTDGGFYWGLPHKHVVNTPIQPVYEQNCDVILVVALSRDELLKREDYPNVKILPIVPSNTLGGNLDGTLDFSNEGAHRRIQHGYEDAKRLLERLQAIIETEAEYERVWKEIEENEQYVDSTLQTMLHAEQSRLELKKAIQSFNQMIVTDAMEEEVEWLPYEQKDLLEVKNFALLKQMERQDIRTKIDQWIDKNAANSEMLQQAALEAVSYAAPIEGQANELKEQGVFSRLWNSITGKNQKIIAANEKDLMMAQYAALSLFQALQQRGVYTLEFAAALQNKANRLFAEIADLHDVVNEQYEEIYRTIGAVYFKFRQAFMEDRQRLDRLEQRVSLLEWMSKIKVHTCEGREYRQLSLPEKMICITNDFYKLTNGSWNVKDLDSLKAALDVLGVEKELVSLQQFFISVAKKPRMVDKLFYRLDGEASVNYEAPVLSLIESIQQNGMKSYEDAALILKEQHVSLEAEQPAYHFVLELLFHLKRNGYKTIASKSLSGIKHEYVQYIEHLLQLANTYGLSKAEIQELVELKHSVEAFKVIVPVIGAFSAGKSTLLNKYTAMQLLSDGLTPETALATELHPSHDEKIVAHNLNGEIRELPISQLSQLQSSAEQLAYLELHLNNPVLFQHEDVILVDMPGLDSNVEAHNKAIRNYITKGTAFLLCVPTEMTLKDSVLKFLRELSLYTSDITIIMTKAELRTADDIVQLSAEHQKNIQTLVGQRVEIGHVSAFHNRLGDFEKAVLRLDQKKEELLKQTFEPLLMQQAAKLQSVLRMLSHAESISLPELARKKEQLQRDITELDHIMDREKKHVLQICQHDLPGHVANDVRSVLEQNRASLFDAMKSGDVSGRMEGLINNAFRMSISSRSERLFQEAAASVSQFVSRHIYSVYDALAEGTVSVDMKDFHSDKNMFDTIQRTALTSGAVGLTGAASTVIAPIIIPIIAGLIGIFTMLKKREQEQKMRAQLQEAIEQNAANVRGQAATTLLQMAESFFASLTEKVENVKKEITDNIALLEEQITKSEQELAQRREEIQKDLASLQHFFMQATQELIEA